MRTNTLWAVVAALSIVLLIGTGGCASPIGSAGAPVELSRDEIVSLVAVVVDVDQGEARRVRAIERLGRGPAEGLAELRTVAGSVLVRERTWRGFTGAVTTAMADVITREGWTECVPALVRSYAIPWKGVSDADRPEKKAIESLVPGKSVVEVAWGEMLRADKEPLGASPMRIDAWNLLERLDPDEDIRQSLYDTRRESRGMFASITNHVLHELQQRRIGRPRTGEEMERARRLFTDGSEIPWKIISPRYAEFWARQAWQWNGGANQPPSWDEVEPTEETSLRHIGVLACMNGAEDAKVWMPKQQLEAALRRRLAHRRFHGRQFSNALVKYTESFEEARPRLSRADLLTLLVIDAAVQESRARYDLFDIARRDRLDTTTEYGGVLGCGWVGFYWPIEEERQGDHAFVASKSMLRDNPIALAHFHFHAQAEDNAELAGPSVADLEYARRYQQHCVVFTSVGKGRLDLDVYFPNGVVVDLGEIAEPGR